MKRAQKAKSKKVNQNSGDTTPLSITNSSLFMLKDSLDHYEFL